MNLSTDFSFGDYVAIDGGPVTGRVIGFCFYPHGQQVQVSWWNNGGLIEQWLGVWRLTELETK